MRNLMRSYWRCELIKLTTKDSSLEFHSTNETEMKEFGMDRNLGNYDLFIFSYSIIRDHGTRVAGVALATPRFLNLLYNFF